MTPRTGEILRLTAPFVVVAALAIAWRSEPMRQILESLPDRMETLATLPAAHVLFVVAFIVAGLVAVPLSVLVVATAAALGALEGAAVSWAGGMASGLTVFLIGRLAGRRSFESLLGERGRRVADRIAERGVLAVAVVRNLPVAPFSVVNLAAGASPVSARDFVLGTAIGLIPGILMLTLVGDRLMDALRSPSPANLALLAGALLGLAILGILASKRLAASGEHDD
jgi:uncharacterized membrane protein YdjX (TVP38/TMEM64 family)